MVSLQTVINIASAADASKKRKRDEDRGSAASGRGLLSKELRLCAPSAAPSGIDLLLEDAPLPPEWQRCLDIKSGEITFYNTRTRTRTARDPRHGGGDADPPLRSHARLDLDLNLGGESPESYQEEEEGEMVAGVCMRCYMLVMMPRSSPTCPNCKFLHPPPPAASRAGHPSSPPVLRL